MNNVNTIIAIICTDDRADAIARVFIGEKNVSVYLIDRCEWHSWNINQGLWDDPKKDHPQIIDILFSHTGDIDNTDLQKIPKPFRTVKFNIDGNPDVNQNEFKLPPFVSYSECPITYYDAEEFLQWARGERIEPPSVCTEERNTLERILSLSVLCSGYLPVHAVYKKKDKDWKNEDIKAALDQMGWYEFLKILDRDRRDDLVSKFRKQKDAVRDAARWRDTFDIPEEDPETSIQDLVKNIKIEWDEKRFGKFPQEVYSLLLKMKNREIAPPKLVADAFCEIAKRLKGR